MKLTENKPLLALIAAPLPWWGYLWWASPEKTELALTGFLSVALLYPLVEEALFRGIIQPAIAARNNRHIGPVSFANIYTSLLFSCAHLIFREPAWAVAVFIPSLAFGYCMERYKQLAAPMLLHCYYNAGMLISTHWLVS